jgi:hypothetical protein
VRSQRTLQLGAVLLVALAAPVPSARAQQSGPGPAPRQIIAVLHAHSEASSGDESVLELAAQARDAGVDVLVLADNLGYDFRYAPWPLRWLVEAHMGTPTLEAHGIERWLAEIRAARETYPEVLMLAGVETPPYYYWTGSLLRGDLTLNDMQRNVLVLPAVGGTDESAAATDLLRGLPAVGNRNLRDYRARSLALLVPGLLLIAVALRTLRRRTFREQRAAGGTAVVALLAGIALLWVNFPYTVPRIEPYGADPDATAQRLLDYVREHGGLTFWSMPQATDYQQRAVGPFGVALSTPPYPEVITATHGYTGFGGVYADTVTMWEPGDIWDRALRQFVAAAPAPDGPPRAAPPWLVGEAAYHYAGQAGKQLDDVLTVLLVDDRSRADAFAALAHGRAYAVRRSAGSPDLRLTELALRDATVGSGGVARLGDTLAVGARDEATFEVLLQVDDAAGGAPTEVTVEVIRNGETVRTLRGVTPLREHWLDTLPADRQAAYYRVIARAARPAYLVSNPVFVRRAAPERVR